MHYTQKTRLDREERFNKALSEAFDKSYFRPDLAVADYMSLDKDSAYVVIAHASGLEAPTQEEVVAFVAEAFEEKLVPVMTTAKYSPDEQAVIVIVARHEEVRPIEDVSTMHTVLAGHRYLDTELGNPWEVATSSDGKQYLRRTSDDDVVAIVKDRKERMGASLRSLSIASMLSCGEAMPGDVVRVYHKGEIFADCEVKASKDRNITVKIPHVGEVTLDKHAVVSVQTLGAKHASQIKKDTRDYFREAYPSKEYADKLTQSLIDEGAQDNRVEKFINPRG